MSNETDDLVLMLNELRLLLDDLKIVSKPRQVGNKTLRPTNINTSLLSRIDRVLQRIDDCKVWEQEQPINVTITVREATPN